MCSPSFFAPEKKEAETQKKIVPCAGTHASFLTENSNREKGSLSESENKKTSTNTISN